MIPPLLLLLACGGEAALSVSPASLDWGEVDFMQDLPPEGYGATTVSVVNDGERELSLVLRDFDFLHLCLQGYAAQDGDPVLPPLPPGAEDRLLVGVCGYDLQAGERDTLVTGELRFVDQDLGLLATVPWSFTPVRNLGPDTGLR